ncbi:MAG: phage holin family protein [Thermoleophilaceae bacterium]|nr:phage holin family protein [Thermoleophilaceae bacterium]
MTGRTRSILGTLLRAIGLIAFNGMILWGLSQFLNGFELPNFGVACLVAAMILLINALLWPIIISLALRFAVFTMGLGSILMAALVIELAAELTDNITVTDSAAIIVVIALTVANILLTTIFGLGERDWYYERVVLRSIRRVVKRQGREIQHSDVPGVFFLEIDGLAEPVLRRAITNGHCPTMARWMQDGSHRIVRWECDLSSQTSASQAGLLQGSNDGIPAFRWYERESGRLVTSSSAKDVAMVEERLSTGKGLLAYGGTSRGNLMSGDAERSLLTLSRVRDKLYSRDFYAYFADPYNPSRTISLGIWDVITEKIEARRQRQLDIQPRVDRGGIYPLLRMGMTVVMRDFNIFSLIGDMFEGVPTSYATFVGYDEVAHHSGIERRDALDVLRRLDQQFARLERIAEFAPRPYKFVVLSDHGQSQGATFLQRFGETLESVVERSIADEHDVAKIAAVDEAWGNIGGAVTQISNAEGATATVVRKQVERREPGAEEARFGPELEMHDLEDKIQSAEDKPDVIVLASGNLGLIYFPESSVRMTREAIEREYPGLITTLATHPGVGFVTVDTDGGPVAIGADGLHHLTTGEVEGLDPLEHFGKHAATHLARNSGFDNAPDIYVVSMFDPESGEVAAFEELVGSHGGLGGTQSEPFALVPSEWSAAPDEIIGARAMHLELVRWLEEVGVRPKEST